MDVLITCIPGHGHFLPCLPLADALAAAGHRVRFATSEAYREPVVAAGHRHVAVGPNYTQTSMRHDIGALARRMFFEGPPAVARDLLAMFEEDAPDVVLADPVDLGPQAAALVSGIPHGVILNCLPDRFQPGRTPLEPAQRPRPASDLLRRLLDVVAELGGQPPDVAEAEWPYERSLNLCMVPPSLLPVPLPWLSHVGHPLRPESRPNGADRDWIDTLPDDRPVVAVSLGTLFGRADTVSMIARAVADAGAHPLVLSRLELDLPPGTTQVTWASMPDVMSACDVVVHHGGWGTTVDALVSGTPAVVVPLGADQHDTAAALARTGAAVPVWPGERVVTTVTAAVDRALRDAVHTTSAARLRSEIEAMPPAAEAVALVEQLATTGGPVRNDGVDWWLGPPVGAD